MNKYINIYNRNNKNKLRNMQSKRPKDYWKYLNRINEKKPTEMPTLEAMY